MNKKYQEIDGIGGVQNVDSSGEILNLMGADTSNLHYLNDNHSTGFYNNLGQVTESKKIFKDSDCDNDRHKYYWDKIKTPFLYFKGFLYDDEDHPNAKAAAAVIRSIHKKDAPLKVKASVEGQVVARGSINPKLLDKTNIKGIALTFVPCNHSTLVEPLSIKKNDESNDEMLIKSVIHLMENENEIPQFREITRRVELDNLINKVNNISNLVKGLTAGYGGMSAPTSRVGGSVMVKESLDKPIGFSYVVCPGCNKEQIYSTNQVKCRTCMKAFPMVMMAKMILKKSKLDPSTIGFKDSRGTTPLHLQAENVRDAHGNLHENLEALLSHKELGTLKDDNGTTPLHILASQAISETIEHKHAGVVKDKLGNTALHYAAQTLLRSDDDKMRILLAGHPMFDSVRNNVGLTPQDILNRKDIAPSTPTHKV